jgi:hypothetical protein
MDAAERQRAPKEWSGRTWKPDRVADVEREKGKRRVSIHVNIVWMGVGGWASACWRQPTRCMFSSCPTRTLSCWDLILAAMPSSR